MHATGMHDACGAHTLFMHACQVCLSVYMDFREDESLLALLAVAYVENNYNRRKKRKQWCSKEWMQRKNKFTHIIYKSFN